MLEADLILDGYRLLRPIGRGGFGEVWLCRLEATGEFKALKFLPASNSAQLERELSALIRYRGIAAKLQCPHLVPIEHVNRTENGLFYTMPLADGVGKADCLAFEWQPKTLAALICERKTAPQWFSADEIQSTMVPVVAAAGALSAGGVVHRDIKPENILFIGGRPCLGDISLLADDSETMTQRGTPGYVAPSWYLQSGGNPDMWGLATTLYSLVTGNCPDKLGRAAFLWPPKGETSVDREAWGLFHRIILRATHEKASERYLRLEDVGNALIPSATDQNGAFSEAVSGTRQKTVALVLVGVLMLSGAGYLFLHSRPAADKSTISTDRVAGPCITTPSHSDFAKKVATANDDFEFLLGEARIKVLGDIPPKPQYVEKFNRLVAKLKTQSSGSQEDIRKTLVEMDGVVPGVQKELMVPDRNELNGFVERLYKAANRQEALAQNAEEGFQGKTTAGILLGKAVAFQEQAEQIITNHLLERIKLVDSLTSARTILYDEKLKAQRTVENAEIEKLLDSIVKKIQ